MTKVSYTDSFVPGSSWVEGVYYNANDNTVAVDLNDEIYSYDNVPRDAVDALVNADSVGGHYNTDFKVTYGPATHLGSWYDVKFEHEAVKPVATTPTTPKALNYDQAETKEYSLNAFDAPVDNNDEDEPTKEFSLDSGPTSRVASDDYGISKVVVHFFDYSADEKKKYVGKSTDVNTVLSDFYEFVNLFDLDVDVNKVVVKF